MQSTFVKSTVYRFSFTTNIISFFSNYAETPNKYNQQFAQTLSENFHSNLIFEILR